VIDDGGKKGCGAASTKNYPLGKDKASGSIVLEVVIL